MKTDEKRVTLGRVVATPGALEALERCDLAPNDLLLRHERGDWGDVCEKDRCQNEWAFARGERLLSVYRLPNSSGKVWIITEWDRSVTTLLTPSEY